MKRTVIHFSHVALPDPRIERIGFLEKKYLNHYIIYIGIGGKSEIFDEVVRVSNFFLYNKREYTIEKIKKLINQYKPDMIHVHDLPAASILSRLSFPFIYNDHELDFYKSLSVLLYCMNPVNSLNIIANIGIRPYLHILKKNIINLNRSYRELLLLATRASAIVTVSPFMKRFYEFKIKHSRVVLIPNFPLANELPSEALLWKFIKEKSECNKSKNSVKLVYTTNSIVLDYSGLYPPRLAKKVLDIISSFNNVSLDIYSKDRLHISSVYKNIHLKGFIPRNKIIETIAKYDGGLLPFEPIRSHNIGGSNKAIEYLHAGLPVIMPASFSGLLELLGKAQKLVIVYKKATRKKLAQSISALNNLYSQGDYIKIMKNVIPYIRKRLIMDNYVGELSKAYR